MMFSFFVTPSFISISQKSNLGLRTLSVLVRRSPSVVFLTESVEESWIMLKLSLVPDDAKQWIVYDVFDTLQYLLKGEWNEITECNEELVSRNLKMGKCIIPYCTITGTDSRLSTRDILIKQN